MSEPRRLMVLGAGGHAKVVIATARAAGWNVGAVFDDDQGRWNDRLLGAQIVGPLEAALDEPIGPAILAVGDNDKRRRLAGELDLEWATLVHPRAVVDASTRLGVGSVVFAGAVAQPDCRIGNHVILNTGASLDHDGRLGSFSHVAPGARLAGGVSAGEGALLGIGCAVLPGVSIGEWVTVGAGSVVLGDVAAGATVAGVPARPVG